MNEQPKALAILFARLSGNASRTACVITMLMR